MAEPWRVGQRVVVTVADPTGHHRAPRYCRGLRGVIVAWYGTHPFPPSVVRGDDPPVRHHLYGVRFSAREMFGAGDHHVTVDLYEPYLAPYGEPDLEEP